VLPAALVPPHRRRQGLLLVLPHPPLSAARAEGLPVLVAAAGPGPRLLVPAVAATPGGRPVEEDLVTGVVGGAEAGVALDAGGIGLAGSAVPGDVAGLEDVTTGAGGRGGGGGEGGEVGEEEGEGYLVCWEGGVEGGGEEGKEVSYCNMG
jgi:hypothetical protein